MTNERKEELELLCSRFRNQLIDLLHSIQTGHPGGSLSCTEILTALYFEIMNVDPQNPPWREEIIWCCPKAMQPRSFIWSWRKKDFSQKRS